jgi:hypothetical protein
MFQEVSRKGAGQLDVSENGFADYDAEEFEVLFVKVYTA